MAHERDRIEPKKKKFLFSTSKISFKMVKSVVLRKLKKKAETEINKSSDSYY
jgi:hypothetical protein